MGKFFLKLVIFALLWVIGSFFFSTFGGSIGPNGSMMFIGSSILGSSLSDDAGDIATMIVSFIITAVVYYIVAELITLLLTRIFDRKH